MMSLLVLAQLPFGFGLRAWGGAQRSSFSDYNAMADWINDNKSTYLGDAAASDYPYLHGTLDLGAEAFVKLSQFQLGLNLGFLSASSHYKTQGTDNLGADYTYKEDWTFKAMPVGLTAYYNPLMGLLIGVGAAYYKSDINYNAAYTSDAYGISAAEKAELSASSPGFHALVGYVHKLGNFGIGAFLTARYAKVSGYKGKATVTQNGDSRT